METATNSFYSLRDDGVAGHAGEFLQSRVRPQFSPHPHHHPILAAINKPATSLRMLLLIEPQVSIGMRRLILINLAANCEARRTSETSLQRRFELLKK